MTDSASGDQTGGFKRVLLKLSGNSLCRAGHNGIHMEEAERIAVQIKEAAESGCQIAVMIGGGNILRGSQFKQANASIEEATAHWMGMLATVINGLALRDALQSLGCPARLMTAIPMNAVAEVYVGLRARQHLQKKRVVVLAAGTGGPFVTTDTAAALRSLELEADIVLKATRVDGVYSDDPETNPNAEFYPELDYLTFLEQRLGVMDRTAITHCMERNMPILVFNYQTPGNIQRAVLGERIGTLISKSD